MFYSEDRTITVSLSRPELETMILQFLASQHEDKLAAMNIVNVRLDYKFLDAALVVTLKPE